MFNNKIVIVLVNLKGKYFFFSHFLHFILLDTTNTIILVEFNIVI